MSDKTNAFTDDLFIAYSQRAREQWLTPYMMTVEGLIADHNRKGIPYDPFDPDESYPSESDDSMTYTIDTGPFTNVDYRTFLKDLECIDRDRQDAEDRYLVDRLIKLGFKVETSPFVTELGIVLPERYAKALQAVSREQAEALRRYEYSKVRQQLMQQLGPDELRKQMMGQFEYIDRMEEETLK